MDSAQRERTRRLAEVSAESKASVHATLEARDEAIADADAAGVPLREIARATGLSVSHVHRIVTRKLEERQEAAVAALGLEPGPLYPDMP